MFAGPIVFSQSELTVGADREAILALGAQTAPSFAAADGSV